MKKVILLGCAAAFFALCKPSLGEAISSTKSNPTLVSAQTTHSQGFWETTIIGTASGVVASLIASGIFWYYFFSKKPKLIVSQVIAKQIDGTSGEVQYRIKVVNLTKTDLINIKFELLLAQVTGYSSTDGEGSVAEIKLKHIKIGKDQPQSEMMIIRRFESKDSEAKYAHQLVITEKLEEKCIDAKSFLLFRISATHSASGFGKVIEKRYNCPLTNHSMKEGSFAGGKSLEIN